MSFGVSEASDFFSRNLLMILCPEDDELKRYLSIKNNIPMVRMDKRFSMAEVSSMIMCLAMTNISTSRRVSLLGSQRSLKNSIPMTMLKISPRNYRNAPASCMCSK